MRRSRNGELCRLCGRGASAALLLVLLAAPAARAQRTGEGALAAATALHHDAAAAARTFASALVEEEGLPGLSVAVGVDGVLVFSEGFGWADLEQRVPVTPLTRFRIGSVSKAVTSAALGLLVEQGRLDLDAPIQRYAMTFPEKRWPVTARQLAGHTAGIRHYRGMENLLNRRWASVTAGLEIFREDSLLFEPGTRYEYSSYGWNLLSAALEGAAQQNFLTLLRSSVFDPLGLHSLVGEHVDSLIPFRARFYERDASGRLRNAPYVDNSYKWAGGGLLGTSEDLVRFGFGIMQSGLLRRETVELLWTPQQLRDGTRTGYGLGWGVVADSLGRRAVGHTGGSVGGRAVLLLFPDDGVVVAMLANATHAPMSFANARRLAEPWLPARRP